MNKSTKVFLDSCIIIYWQEMVEPFYSKFIALLSDLNSTYLEASIAISRLSILECLVKPLREQNLALCQQYEDFFNHESLEIIEINAEIVHSALKIRANTTLKIPDAIQAASALALGKQHLFLSCDKSFSQVKALNIKAINMEIKR